MALVHGIKPIVTSGLVLCLDAGNRKSYPGSGTTWTDLSGNGRNGTLTNMSGTNFNSANGGSLTFDGTDEYVLPTGLTDSFWQGNWTANFWVNFDIIYAGFTDNTLLQHGTSASSSGLHLTTRFSIIIFGLYSNDLVGNTALTAGTWYNIVFTLNNTTGAKQIYLNSTLDNSHTGGSYIGTGNNARIGGCVLNFGLTFDGFMSSCSFYNRVLTATEIAQNYNALKGRYGLS